MSDTKRTPALECPLLLWVLVEPDIGHAFLQSLSVLSAICTEAVCSFARDVLKETNRERRMWWKASVFRAKQSEYGIANSLVVGAAAAPGKRTPSQTIIFKLLEYAINEYGKDYFKLLGFSAREEPAFPKRVGFSASEELVLVGGECMRASAHGDLELLDWLHRHGAEFDALCAQAAVNYGDLEVVKWLKDRNCPMQGAYREAVNGRQLRVAEWLIQEGLYNKHDDEVEVSFLRGVEENSAQIVGALSMGVHVAESRLRAAVEELEACKERVAAARRKGSERKAAAQAFLDDLETAKRAAAER